jgi:hypothetical protein
MKSLKNWTWLLVFGSLWGIMEVVGGEAFFRNNVPHASVWLSGWAFLLLATARGIVNKPGSSTVVGATATLFKLAYAAPYFCHLLGIFYIGLVFDIGATLLMKNVKKFSWRSLLTGIITAYGGYALFAITIAYIAKYGPWLSGGAPNLPKVLNHIFSGGSLAALTALVLVPLGFKIGLRSESAVERRSKWATAGALIVLAVLWTLGKFIS